MRIAVDQSEVRETSFRSTGGGGGASSAGMRYLLDHGLAVSAGCDGGGMNWRDAVMQTRMGWN